MESAEPWKLEQRGLRDCDDPALISPERVKQEEEQHNSPPSKKMKFEENSIKLEGENKENLLGRPILTSSPLTEAEEALRKLGCDIMVTPKIENKPESKFAPKVTPNGDKLNQFNHSAYFNMLSVSPVVLNGSVTITPKDGGPVERPERPWFSLLARPDSPGLEGETELQLGRPGEQDTAPHLTLLEKKLGIVREMNKECSRRPIPKGKHNFII